MTIDLLITNARVRTFDPQSPWAEAVGIQDGLITHVGTAADAPAGCTTQIAMTASTDPAV